MKKWVPSIYYTINGNRVSVEEHDSFIAKNNQITATIKLYHADDRIIWEISYVKGQKEGLYKRYYRNGNLQEEQSFMNDKAHRLGKKYNEEGRLIEEVWYCEGKKILPPGKLAKLIIFGDKI